jgi:4'-phosphopantetheinyl transferase
MHLDATERRIDLWRATPGRIDDHRLLQEYRRLLSDTERRLERRMHILRDQRRYLVTRALVRIVLSKYAPVAPDEWIFAPNQYGKPQIANAHARDISFNVTHGGELIIVGVARGVALGIDTESVRARLAPLDLADRYFTDDEANCLRAAPAAHQQRLFFEYWTLKEAYIKARGIGMSIPLEHVGFRFVEAKGVRLWIHPAQCDTPARWCLWQLWPDADHVVSVCVERNGAERPLLSMTDIVPLASEFPCDYRLTRISDAS